jgi:hypothetical protein
LLLSLGILASYFREHRHNTDGTPMQQQRNNNATTTLKFKFDGKLTHHTRRRMSQPTPNGDNYSSRDDDDDDDDDEVWMKRLAYGMTFILVVVERILYILDHRSDRLGRRGGVAAWRRYERFY